MPNSELRVRKVVDRNIAGKDELKNINEHIEEIFKQILAKQPQLGFFHWLLLSLCVAVLYGLVVWQDGRMPAVSSKDHLHTFSEERARLFLDQITSLGPRPTGSNALEVQAVQLITGKITSLKQIIDRSGVNRLELDPLVAENDVEEEMNTLWEELQAIEATECESLDYLNFDQDLVTGGTLTLKGIAETVSTAEAEYDSDTGEVIIDEEEPVQPAVTTREVIEGFKLFQCYVETNFADPAMLGMCDKLDELLTDERLKKMKQKNLFDYFTTNK